MATRNGVQAPDPMRFAACRANGHEWHHHKPIGSDEATGMTEQPKTKFRAPFGGSYGMVGIPSICTQCGSERMRWLTRSGESLMRYNHPDGYEQRGDDRMLPIEWRKAYVATVFDSFVDPYIVRESATA